MKTSSYGSVRRPFKVGALAGRAGLLTALICPLACGPTGEYAGDEADVDTDQQASALLASADGYFGALSHVSPVTTTHTNTKKEWQPIPGLAGAVTSRAGDSLLIRVSAEMLGGETAYVRAKVDGVPLDWVIFKRAGESSDEVRDFTFVRSNVTEGQHLVEIEWWATDDVIIRARTMTMESLPPDMGGVASAWGQIEKTTDSWEDIPGMSKTVTTTTGQDFAITFSADSIADSGRVRVRALVDGSAVSDVGFVEAGGGSRYGARSFTFIRKNLMAGAHDVRIQWRVEGGKGRLGPRTLAVSAGRPIGGSGLEALGMSSAETTYQSTQYVTVLSRSFTTQGDNSSAILSFGAEIKATGRAYVRALLDGVPTSDAAVQLAHGGDSFRVASYAFPATNIAPGRHQVELQIAVESGKSATVRKKFVRALYRPRSGSELVRSFDGMKPAQRRRKLLALCFDPMRPEHPRPSKAMLRDVFEGTDGGLSVKGWFANNSGGRLTFDSIRYVGCEDNGWLLPPPAHRGWWYWNENAFDVMRRDALHAADGEVDFHGYDVDGDNFLSPDEIGVMIVIPQKNPDSFVRTASTFLDGVRSPMKVQLVDLYLSNDPLKRRLHVGLTSHELSHGFLGAWDLHTCDSPVSANAFSIMDDHSKATSIDPLHKLKSGWVTPSLIALPVQSTSIVQLSSVASTGKIVVLQNRNRRDGEYFILENRAPGEIYDGPVLDSGIVVWQILEDASIDKAFPAPPPSCPEGRTRIRRLGMLKGYNATLNLDYADGTSTGVRLRSLGSPGSSHSVAIEPR